MSAATMTAAAAGPILALDLGKYKSVACAYPGDPAGARFESVTTDRDRLRRLFAKYRPAVVVLEACALAGWVHDLCAPRYPTSRAAEPRGGAWELESTKRQ